MAGLQHISLPQLLNGKFRAFPIEGDSMPPFRDGNFIIGEYVEKLSDIKNGNTYLVVTKSNMVYKRVYRKAGKLLFHSDNSFFQPYEIAPEEISEVWKFKAAIINEEFIPDTVTPDKVTSMLQTLLNEIQTVKTKLT